MKRSTTVLCAIAGALCSWGGGAHASCPAALNDQLVSSTSWNSPTEAALGISLDSSYRMLGTQYVLSAVDPRSLQPVMLYRFYGSDHSSAGSAVTANTSSVSYYNWVVESVATYWDNANVWATVWEGDSVAEGTHPSWIRRFSTSLSALATEATILSDTTYDYQFKPTIDVSPDNGYFVVGTIAMHPTSGYDRPYFRIVRPSGTEYVATTLIDSSTGWNAISMHVDAFASTNYNTQIAVSWVEVSTSGSTRIRFKIYDSDGSVSYSARTISPLSGRKLKDVRIAGSGNRVTMVWDSVSTSDRYDSDTYMQAWPILGTTALYTARMVDPNAYYSTYMPDISANQWVASNGYTYDVYSITYSTITTGCDASSGYCLYPTIHLFKSTSSPVDTTGPQYLSWYPQSEFNTYTDGVRTEVFTGCNDQVVIAGVDYADSDLNPSAQRGLRRTFIAVSGSSVYSASSSGSMFSEYESDNLSLASDGSDLQYNPYSALENDAYIVSSLLLDDGESATSAE